MRISRRKDRLPGTIISLILLMVIAAFAVLLIYTRLLPTKYIAIIFLSLLIFLLVVRLLVLRFQKAGSLLERYGTCSTHNCSPGSRKPVYSQDGIGPGYDYRYKYRDSKRSMSMSGRRIWLRQCRMFPAIPSVF